MANTTKAAEKSAAPKKVYYTAENKSKYEIVGKRFFYKGEKYTAEQAAKNKELMEKLITNKAPAIKKV